jgi:hypothetical protein
MFPHFVEQTSMLGDVCVSDVLYNFYIAWLTEHTRVVCRKLVG